MSWELTVSNLIHPYPHPNQIRLLAHPSPETKLKIIFKIFRETIVIHAYVQLEGHLKYSQVSIGCVEVNLTVKINLFIQTRTHIGCFIQHLGTKNSAVFLSFSPPDSSNPPKTLKIYNVRTDSILDLKNAHDLVFVLQHRQADPALQKMPTSYLNLFLNEKNLSLEDEIKELIPLLPSYNHSERSQLLNKILTTHRIELKNRLSLIPSITDFVSSLIVLIYRNELTFFFSKHNKDLRSFSNFGLCYRNFKDAENPIEQYLNALLQALNNRPSPQSEDELKITIYLLECLTSILELTLLCNYTEKHFSFFHRLNTLIQRVTSRLKSVVNLRIQYLINHAIEYLRILTLQMPTCAYLYSFVMFAKDFTYSEEINWKIVLKKISNDKKNSYSVSFWWEHLFILKLLFLTRENDILLKKLQTAINFQLLPVPQVVELPPIFSPEILPIFIQGVLEVCTLHLRYADIEEQAKAIISAKICNSLCVESLHMIEEGFLRQYREVYRANLQNYFRYKAIKIIYTHPLLILRQLFAKFLKTNKPLTSLEKNRLFPMGSVLFQKALSQSFPDLPALKTIREQVLSRLQEFLKALSLENSVSQAPEKNTPIAQPTIHFGHLFTDFLEDSQEGFDGLIIYKNHPQIILTDLVKSLQKLWNQFSSTSWVVAWVTLKTKSPQTVLQRFIRKLNLSKEFDLTKMQFLWVWNDLRADKIYNPKLFSSLRPILNSHSKIVLITTSLETMPEPIVEINSQETAHLNTMSDFNKIKKLNSGILKLLHLKTSASNLHPFLHEIQTQRGSHLNEIFTLKYTVGTYQIKVTVNIDCLAASYVKITSNDKVIFPKLNFKFHTLDKSKLYSLLQDKNNFSASLLKSKGEHDELQVEFHCPLLLRDEEELYDYYNSKSFCQNKHLLSLEANWCQDPYQGEGRRACLKQWLTRAKGKPELAILVGNVLSVLVLIGESFCESILDQLHVKNADITRGNFKDASWQHAILENVVAHQINIGGTSFVSTKLLNVDFGVWLQLPLKKPLELLKLSSNEKWLVGITSQKMMIWTPSESEMISRFSLLHEIESVVTTIEFSHNSQFFAVGTSQGYFHLYEISTKKQLCSFRFDQPFSAIHFSLDDSSVAVVLERKLHLVFISKDSPDRRRIKLGPGWAFTSKSHLLFAAYSPTFYLTIPEENNYSIILTCRFNEGSCLQENALVVPFVVHSWQVSSHGYHLIALCPNEVRICRKETLAESIYTIPTHLKPLWVYLEDPTSTLSMVFADGVIVRYLLRDSFKAIFRRQLTQMPIKHVAGLFQENYIIIETKKNARLKKRAIRVIEINPERSINYPIKDEILATHFAKNTQSLYLFTACMIIKYDPNSLDHYSILKTSTSYQTSLDRLRKSTTSTEGVRHLMNVLKETPFPIHSHILETLGQTNAHLQGLAVESGRNYLASHSFQNELTLWNLLTSKDPWVCSLHLTRLSTLTPAENSPKTTALSLRSAEQRQFIFAISANYEGEYKTLLYEFNASPPQQLKVLKLIRNASPLVTMCFSKQHLWALDKEQNIKNWSIDPAKEEEKKWSLRPNVITFTLHEPSNLLIYTTLVKEIVFFDMSTGKLLHQTIHETVFRELHVNSSGTQLCAVEREGFGVAIWDLERTKNSLTVKLRREGHQTFKCKGASFTGTSLEPNLQMLLSQNGAILK